MRWLDIRQAYADWIECPLVEPDQLTGSVLADILSPLTQWLSKRAGGKKSNDAFDALEWLVASRALAQLEAIIRNETELTGTGLENLLVEWRQSVSISTRFPGQVGATTTLASPAQILAAQDHLIWWCPTPTITQRSPWTSDEQDWLASQNVSLLDEKALALAAEKATERAVLLAGKVPHDLSCHSVCRRSYRTGRNPHPPADPI